jgi:hypothetical protein
MNNDSTKFNFVFIDDKNIFKKMVYVKIDNEFEVMGCKSFFKEISQGMSISFLET